VIVHLSLTLHLFLVFMPHLQLNFTLGACQTHLIFALVLQCAKLNLVLAGKPVLSRPFFFVVLLFFLWFMNSLCIKGPQLPKKIRALASYKDYTFAAYGSDIAVFKRTDEVRKLLCYHLNLCYMSAISYIAL